MSDQLSPSDFELIIDNECRRYLHDTARWGKFLAIAGIIMAVALVVMGMVVINQASRDSGFSSYRRRANDDREAGGIGMLVIGLIYFFPAIMLWRYSEKLGNAVAANSQEELVNAFRTQRNLFIYRGILAILGLLIFLLAVIGIAANN
jgi:hypothetical protein